jgi:sugar phosphate isomerase/epimerase
LSTRYTPDTKKEALDWWKETADSHKAIGCNTMVVPSLPSQGRGISMEIDFLNRVCEYFNDINAIAKERGMRAGFHNHAAEELKLPNGKIILDYIVENTDPTFFIQLDNHNMIHPHGRDPIPFLHQYNTRIKVLHVKDYDIIGASGKVDFQKLFTAAAQYNIFEPIVEVENYPMDVMECMRRSFTFLNNAAYVQYFG